MAVTTDELITAVWIYDIDRYHIHWANDAALVLWEADSLAELCARDFKPGTSDAVQESLRNYQCMFKRGEKLSQFWRFSPKGITKEAFCHFSGYRMADGRMALLVEATPAHSLSGDVSLRAVAVLSTYYADGRFLSGNPPFIDEIGSDIGSLSELFIDAEISEQVFRTLREDGRYEGDVRIKTCNGDTWYHVIAVNSCDEAGQDTILLQQYNIHERKMSELALAREVLTDPLTGLTNRRGLSRELEQIASEGVDFILFYIDLDGFKLINDSFGHAMGDLVLKSLAQRLSDPVFARGLSCRFGGDEFIWVVRKKDLLCPQEDIASLLVSKISDTYYDDQGSPLVISASVGIACYPEHGKDIAQLILRADAAMYFAKQKGKRRWISYTPGMEQSLKRHSLLAQRLHLAIENDELSLHYQPIFDFTTGEIISFEALLRWHSPELGAIPADETIHVAEEIGIIGNIENWVIRRALADLSILRESTAPEASMSINISGIHLADPELPELLLAALRETDLQPDDLIIELTETALLVDVDRPDNPARRLHDRGISIAIDDFGTGYSSLAYLHTIPASIVKIDRRFVNDVEHNPHTVANIHRLITSLEMKTLIEGVETEGQRRVLAELGIQLQQGYLLGRPQALSHYRKARRKIAH